MAGKTNSYFSTTLEKGMRILSLFNQERIKCSLTEISRLTGINMTSTYRFVNTFVEMNYLRRDPDSKLIKLGPRAVALGHGFLRGFDLLQMIKPIIDEAYETNGVTVDTALLDGDSLFIIYRREAGNTLTYRLPTVTNSLHCSALGKSVLAFLPEKEALEIFDRQSAGAKTGNTILQRDGLRRELRLTRKRGYSINNEEYIPGLIAIGAPLMNTGTGRVVGSICFDLSTAQITTRQMEERYAGAVVGLAKEVSEVMPIV